MGAVLRLPLAWVQKVFFINGDLHNMFGGSVYYEVANLFRLSDCPFKAELSFAEILSELHHCPLVIVICGGRFLVDYLSN
ncbi:hypothetical protein GN244_ATG18699 [Phytophthora infestans]|uniref:Uncharacterized protein n=1 Tax=Phytophthora infestans TaxID=4787 RepID=A0A833SKY3_PHYIN|nr:hypothetical protein GN244_ATG18699 [Phytophthora infestans]KAF4138959.1 hypothetical protein GN958_ATG11916 [Phytophthora infestans]